MSGVRVHAPHTWCHVLRAHSSVCLSFLPSLLSPIPSVSHFFSTLRPFLLISVMVLGDGKLLEMDSPAKLVKKQDGVFAGMHQAMTASHGVK